MTVLSLTWKSPDLERLSLYWDVALVAAKPSVRIETWRPIGWCYSHSVRLVGQYEYRMRDYYCGNGFWVSCKVLWTVMTKGKPHCLQRLLAVPCTALVADCLMSNKDLQWDNERVGTKGSAAGTPLNEWGSDKFEWPFLGIKAHISHVIITHTLESIFLRT